MLSSTQQEHWARMSLKRALSQANNPNSRSEETDHPIPAMLNRVIRHHRLVATGLALALIAYHAIATLDFGVAQIGGVTYFLVDDDVMISMRYGKNLAEGLGLVYNPGERVEGFTNPLLTLLTAALHLLPIDKPVLPAIIQLTNLILSLCIVPMLVGFWGRHPHERLAGLVAAGFYVTLPNHSFYAHAGYEVYMTAAILLYSIRRIEHFNWIDAFILGLLPLTHSTASLLWVFLVAVVLITPRSPVSKRLILAVLACAAFLGYEIFRIAYYGEALPNTFWLKAGAGSLRGGIIYVKSWVTSILPLAVLASFSCVTAWNRKTVIIMTVTVVHILSVVLIGGDIFPQYRFLFPVSVLLAALAGRSVAMFSSRLTSIPTVSERAWFSLLLATTVAYSWVFLPYVNYRASKPEYEAIRRWNIRHIVTGLAINENTSQDALIALFGLGYTGYYGERVTIDMLGKTDRHIARTAPVAGRLVGHNKADFDYVLARQPELVELGISPDKLRDVTFLAEHQHDPYGYSFELGMHPVFRQVYMSHPVVDEAGRYLPFYARTPSTPWKVLEEYFANLPPK